MSNLLKSKFLLGVMVVAVMLVGFAVVNTNTAAAASCTITKTLKVGSKGAEVKCLQAALNLTADGSFGKKTKAAVVAWQKTMNLVADGIFGAKSRAAWVGGAPVSTTGGTLPAGCTSTSGYSPTTGLSCATGTPANTSGPLAVSVATDNPASGYIVGNQATADLAHFTFTGNGTVQQVVLQRTGVSDQNTLSNVYLYDGATRLTDGYSFNNSGQLTMNNLNVVVSGSKTLSVKADVALVTNASTLGITLVGYDVDTLASTPLVTVNLSGNTMTYGQGNLASVYLNSANQTVGASSVNAGTSAFTVWSSPIQVNVRAVSLKGANFRMVGSAPADALQNIKLYVDGVATGTVATMGTIGGTNYAMFNFASPVSLSTGSHTVDLRADVVKGASYNVTVSVQQAADLVLFDPQVGVNIAVLKDGTPTAYVSSTSGQISINTGSASVVVDPAFQTLTNVTGGATNTVIARYKVHGYGEDVKVSTLNVTPIFTGTMTPTAAGLNNLTVYFNGSQVGSSFNVPASPATPATHAFSLGSQMILPAGADSMIEIRADLQTAGSVNYTAGSVSADLTLGASNAQGQTSHQTLNFPGASVTGTILAVQTGVLSVSRNAANSTSNPNTANVKIGSFTLQNQSSSESVRVTSLQVSLTTNGTTPLDNTTPTVPALNNFSNLKTSETSGSGSTPIQPAATNTFSVDFTLAPGATKALDVFADLGAANSNTVVTKLLVTSLGSSSNVSISQNGTGVAVVGQTITLAASTVAAPTLVSSASTTAQFVPAATSGATNATKAEFNIGATNGTATVSEMKFAVRGPSAIAGLTTLLQPVTSISVGSVSAPVVQAVTNSTTLGANMLVGDTSATVVSATGIAANSVLTVGSEDMLVVSDAGGTTVTTIIRGFNGTTAAPHTSGDAVSVKNGVAYLTGLNLAVPNGGSGLNVDAMVTYAPVGTNGVPSQTLATVGLSYMKYTAGGTTSTKCVAGCSTTAAEVPAPTMEVVGSKPTIAVAGSTDQLSNSLVKLAEVTVSADAKGDIKLVALPIQVSTTPASGGVSWSGLANGLVVKDTSGSVVATTNSVVVIAGSCTGTTAATTGVCTSTITFTNDYLIPAGTSKTFRIYATAASVSGAVNTMSLSTTLGASSLFSWKDVAGANATAITGTDMSTYFYNYPTDTSVIHN